MVTYYVNKNDIYKVTATVSCDVLDGNNELIAICQSGETISFKAPTSKISLSDDNAVLSRGVGSSGDIGDVDEHVCDPSIHCTPEEKENWNTAVTSKIPDFESHVKNSSVHVSASDRVNWNGKLDKYEVYESIVVNPLGDRSGDANVRGFAYVIPRTGYVTAIDTYCRTEGDAAPYPTTITAVKVWRGNGELLGTSSIDYQGHITGSVQKYKFSTPFYVERGEELRVTYHTGDNWNATEYTVGVMDCCIACVALTSGERGGLIGVDGTITDSTCTAKHYWYIDAEKFAPFEHLDDEGKHLRDGERESWNAKANENHTHTTSDITDLDVGVKRIDYGFEDGEGVSIYTKSSGQLSNTSGFSDYKEYKATKDVCLIYHVSNSPNSGNVSDFSSISYNYPIKLWMNVKINGSYRLSYATYRRICTGGLDFIEVHLKAGDEVQFCAASVDKFSGCVSIKLLEFNYR